MHSRPCSFASLNMTAVHKASLPSWGAFSAKMNRKHLEDCKVCGSLVFRIHLSEGKEPEQRATASAIGSSRLLSSSSLLVANEAWVGEAEKEMRRHSNEILQLLLQGWLTLAVSAILSGNKGCTEASFLLYWLGFEAVTTKH